MANLIIFQFKKSLKSQIFHFFHFLNFFLAKFLNFAPKKLFLINQKFLNSHKKIFPQFNFGVKNIDFQLEKNFGQKHEHLRINSSIDSKFLLFCEISFENNVQCKMCFLNNKLLLLQNENYEKIKNWYEKKKINLWNKFETYEKNCHKNLNELKSLGRTDLMMFNFRIQEPNAWSRVFSIWWYRTIDDFFPKNRKTSKFTTRGKKTSKCFYHKMTKKFPKESSFTKP